MASDLVKKLRTCSKEERRGVAMELAERGDDEAVNELKRMFEGEMRTLFRWYDIDAQIIAIEAFPKTRRAELAVYLLKSMERLEVIWTYGPYFYDDKSKPVPEPYYLVENAVRYPNLKGKLKEAMEGWSSHHEPLTLEDSGIKGSRGYRMSAYYDSHIGRGEGEVSRLVVAALKELEGDGVVYLRVGGE